MKFSRYIILLIGVVVIGLAATSIYFYRKAHSAAQSTEQISKKEAELLAEEVAKIAVVPVNETPVIATVSDPEQLKAQPFFAEAKIGFKVLIYTNEKKAVLYDPVQKKIVNIAPLNMSEAQQKAISGEPKTTTEKN